MLPLLRIRLFTCLKQNLKTSQLITRQISTSKQLLQNVRFKRFVSPEKERLYKIKDRIPEGYTIIYRAPMEYYIIVIKAASTLTLTALFGFICYDLGNDKSSGKDEKEYMTLMLDEDDYWYFLAGIIAFNFALQWLTTKYPLRIYRNKDSYIAMFTSQIPTRNVQHQFQRARANGSGRSINPWGHLMYKLDNKNAILLNYNFKTPADFNAMMGHQ
ncbi:uncharacterized protein LOC119677887 [Teleopsis dalmanni]|uniref:uncharacterized protein LOC119677887 n=1 Tax=Teleopsis dalmanni TaxID=139649 RepID=UPI0018CEB029|nr:uncharacterized protein LOC119677887 [Teleopsis dalmanni]